MTYVHITDSNLEAVENHHLLNSNLKCNDKENKTSLIDVPSVQITKVKKHRRMNGNKNIKYRSNGMFYHLN